MYYCLLLRLLRAFTAINSIENMNIPAISNIIGIRAIILFDNSFQKPCYPILA